MSEVHTHRERTAPYRQCACLLCRQKRAEYSRRRRAAAKAGEALTVKPDETVEYIQRLLDEGNTAQAIAAAADIEPRTVQRLAYGPRGKFILRSTADAILGVTVDVPIPAHRPDGEIRLGRSDGPMVPASKLTPFIEEIRRAGYTYAEIGKIAKVANVAKVKSQRRVWWSTWVRITTVYVLMARRGYVRGDLLEEIPNWHSRPS